MAELTQTFQIKADAALIALLEEVNENISSMREHFHLLEDRIATLECQVQVLNGDWHGK